MLKQLRKLVYVANKQFQRQGMTDANWGNVSGIDRERELVVVKPGDVSCKDLTAEDMLIIDMHGNVKDGEGEPAPDVFTQLQLYKAFPKIGGIAFMHSTWATVFAQAGLGIKPYGLKHTQHFRGTVPCTRTLTDEEIRALYQEGVGDAIIETFAKIDPMTIPAVLVNNYAPFAWGESPSHAVSHATALEKIAKLAYHTNMLGLASKHKVTPISDSFYDMRG
ncbi:MAG: class II aldolase/adducin family protein [Defluviitaleaceae bacterium]|nr:class II aldolase/adducin family protein [Defluviitaleaceae bacterium]MCL2275575.1 class II aldolase/adducin family protein [Defluviitaleaceae bacterium]